MSRILKGASALLLDFVTNAYTLQNLQSDRGLRDSKRHPVGSDDTGPNAATLFRSKRSYARHSPRTLRKLDREHRIHNGTAPLQHGVPGKRERKIIDRAKRRAGAGA